MPTIEEKYNFLLQQLKVTDADWWEGDALIRLEKPIYFQFPMDMMHTPEKLTVDQAVVFAMDDWLRDLPKDN